MATSRETRPGTALTERVLLAMPGRDLDELFRAYPTSVLPNGRGAGTVLLATGTRIAGPLATLFRRLAWKGKVVDRERGTLVNVLTPRAVPAVRALVAPGPSLVDGRPCVVIDYSRTSHVARWVRDEIREVEPGLWVGLAFAGRRRVARFALRFAR